jgi:triacylglycerol lipase
MRGRRLLFASSVAVAAVTLVEQKHRVPLVSSSCKPFVLLPSLETLTPPRNPILFCHGWGGFDTAVYFRGVLNVLEDRGCSVVPTSVSPFGSIDNRAAHLADQIRRYCTECSAVAGSPVKVNIIAHSMGGLDVRYAVSAFGLSDCVACVVSVSTPHLGSELAVTPTRVLEPLLKQLHQEWGVDLLGLTQLTPSQCTIFNDQCPDVDGVVYMSVAGVSKENCFF